MKKILLALTAVILIFTGCADNDRSTQKENSPAYVQFFEMLSEECGNAYAGELMIQPETVNMFTGTEQMEMHFMECTENELKIPFHIEDESGDPPPNLDSYPSRRRS